MAADTQDLETRLRLAHQARRAKEHQLDDIRRALCDIGFMEDGDPYSHADLADVIRQNGDTLRKVSEACGSDSGDLTETGPAATEATQREKTARVFAALHRSAEQNVSPDHRPHHRVTMPKFRKKPVEITAIQFTGDNVNEIWDAFGADGIYGPTEKNPDHLILTTVHGDEAPAWPGDWVIPDGKPGTFYPCKPDIFAATYELLAAVTRVRALHRQEDGYCAVCTEDFGRLQASWPCPTIRALDLSEG